MTEDISKISVLKKRIVSILKSESPPDPTAGGYFELFFKENEMSTKYKIIIQAVEEKFFIDSKGRKWIRADEE